MKYDLAILGGGAAGMMAAISARQNHPNWNIVLIEKNPSLGRKILTTGNGRCNLTNINLSKNGAKYFNNPNFAEKVFKQFGYKEIVNFFTDLGLVLVEEKKGNSGKIFPASDAASSVVNLLSVAVQENHIRIQAGDCRQITKEKDVFVLSLKEGDKILADKIILAAGGRTYPALGADGSGFSLAEKLGHTIVLPIPSGVSLEGKDRLAQELQGLKMSAEISLPDKQVFSGDVMFTKYGLSGTAVLLASRPVSVWLNREHKKEVSLVLNFMPGYEHKTAVDFWVKRKQQYPQRDIVVDWSGVFSPKFASVFLKVVGLSGKYSNVSVAQLEKAIKLLTNYNWRITATRGWNEAEFTAGGVNCAEIDSRTLESKKIPGLYFAGEVMDIDGEIGGYNLSWAWASGLVAGKIS